MTATRAAKPASVATQNADVLRVRPEPVIAVTPVGWMQDKPAPFG